MSLSCESPCPFGTLSGTRSESLALTACTRRLLDVWVGMSRRRCGGDFSPAAVTTYGSTRWNELRVVGTASECGQPRRLVHLPARTHNKSVNLNPKFNFFEFRFQQTQTEFCRVKGCPTAVRAVVPPWARFVHAHTHDQTHTKAKYSGQTVLPTSTSLFDYKPQRRLLLQSSCCHPQN